MNFTALRDHYRRELFQVCLPFWERYGIDHERGGFRCSLDYDGTCINTHKFHWFQGRGLWVYSFLYNHFGQDPRRLAIARKTKEFLLRHFPQPDGWWAELVSEDGKVLRPFSGDVYGMFFAAEGLQEYAWAAGDDDARRLACDLVKRLFRHADSHQGAREQGFWMVSLRVATQMLRRWQDAELSDIAGRSLDAILHRHYNPEIGLNNETLNFDFSRPAGEATKSQIGHSIETLWMAMDEADRRGDPQLWQLCAERIHRHLEAGWDRLYGGLLEWVNAGCADYVWPPERPAETGLEFRAQGEYFDMKSMWSLSEVLIATLNVYQRTGAEWAAAYFDKAHRTIEEKFSQRKHGLPGYMLFTDRQMTRQPHVQRQDNYHPPRQLALNILTLDRMISRSAGAGTPSG